MANLDLTSSAKYATPNSCLSTAGFEVISSMTFFFPLWNMSLQVNVERFAFDSADSNTAVTQHRCKTDSEVESHFHYVKHDLLKSKLKLRQSIFLNKFLVNVRETVNDVKLSTRHSEGHL